MEEVFKVKINTLLLPYTPFRLLLRGVDSCFAVGECVVRGPLSEGAGDRLLQQGAGMVQTDQQYRDVGHAAGLCRFRIPPQRLQPKSCRRPSRRSQGESLLPAGILHPAIDHDFGGRKLDQN